MWAAVPALAATNQVPTNQVPTNQEPINQEPKNQETDEQTKNGQPAIGQSDTRPSAQAVQPANALSPAVSSPTVSPSNAKPTPPIAPPPPGDFSWGGYFQAIGLMFLLLVGVWGVVSWLRRSGRFPRMIRPGSLPRDALYLEGQISLGPNKGLVVVRFLNKRVLLGVTEQRISLLTEAATDDHEADFAAHMDALSRADDKTAAAANSTKDNHDS